MWFGSRWSFAGTGVDAALVGFCGAVATAASACVGVASVGGVCGAVLVGPVLVLV